MAWRQHLDESELPQNSLILLGRGYVDFTLLRNIYDLGHHFCVRLKSNLKVTQVFIARLDVNHLSRGMCKDGEH